MSSQSVSLGDGLQQHSRELPQRIHTAKVYPLNAPDGSTIVVYGHENGVSVFWTARGQSVDGQHEEGPALASVIHTLDIYLGGAEALRIDFPKLTSTLHHDSRSIPTLLSKYIVVGVACSDYAIRLISLPLAPTEGEGHSEQVLLLVGEPSHQSIPTCLSITFTTRENSADPDAFNKHSTPRTASKVGHQSVEQENMQWDLVVASASSDLSGRLLIHRIPCTKSCLDGSAKHSIPWEVLYLASPAVSVNFSSAAHPSSHHLQLLIAEAYGRVRIEDYHPEINSAHRTRSLHKHFDFSSGWSFSKATRILECRWLLEGKAAVALLNTGEWFVWDITNTGPQSITATTKKGVGMSGSQVAISGWVQAKAVKPSTGDGDSNGPTSKFAPMTPSTRKIRQQALFASEHQKPSSLQHGGINVIPSSAVSSHRGDDNCVLFWHGTTIIVIPNFLSYWQNQVRGSGHLFEENSKGEVIIITNVRFGCETCHEVTLDPCSNDLGLIISAGRRLITIESASRQKRRLSATPQALPDLVPTDQGLLAASELDLIGMNHVLESMSNGSSLEKILVQRNVKPNKPK